MTRRHDGDRRANSQPLLRRALARTLVRAARCLSLPAAQRLADAAATTLWHLSARDRRNAEKNLRSIFGDSLVPEQRNRIALNALRNRCKRLVELAHLPRLTEEDLRDLVVVEQVEYIREAMQAGRGVMVVTNHFCNPELIGARLALEGIDLAVVARLDRARSVAPSIQPAYESAGVRVLAPNDLSGIVAHLRSKGCVALLPELHRRRSALRFEVHGLPVWIAKGAGLVAMRTGCAIVPGLAARRPDNRVRAVVEPPLQIDDAAGAPRATQIQVVCEALAEVLAGNIVRRPGDWLWLHHRWPDAGPAGRAAATPASDRRVCGAALSGRD